MSATPTVMQYEAALAAYTARVVAGEPMNMDEVDALTRMGHAAKYPNGCREPGHNCQECQARLGERPHDVAAVRVGGRPGYRANWRYQCRECSYEAGS